MSKPLASYANIPESYYPISDPDTVIIEGDKISDIHINTWFHCTSSIGRTIKDLFTDHSNYLFARKVPSNYPPLPDNKKYRYLGPDEIVIASDLCRFTLSCKPNDNWSPCHESMGNKTKYRLEKAHLVFCRKRNLLTTEIIKNVGTPIDTPSIEKQIINPIQYSVDLLTD